MCDSQNYELLGAVDYLINYIPRPSVLADSSSGGPQHLGADSFDCRTEKYEIVV